ncbi:MAG: hypothetical protein ONB11_01145 [candidate division KSB1 bacterium]|nr:hypothetical protein [candidate division KSB1 bacterium]MDZ7340244.1 hypothetical protein [candidate division KSB1 bacterium]
MSGQFILKISSLKSKLKINILKMADNKWTTGRFHHSISVPEPEATGCLPALIY